MIAKEIKIKIRELRKIKKDTQKKTPLRHSLNKQIRELKEKLKELRKPHDPEKQKLVEEILKREPELKKLRSFDLYKFSVEQLKKHLERKEKK